MSSLNKVSLIGNLGKDPEHRVMPSGDSVCNFPLATTEKWTDKSTGEKKEATEWHNISIFGNLAGVATQYLSKGSKVYVEGKIQTRKYTDKSGVEKYSTGIKVDTFGGKMIMLGGNESAQAAPSAQNTTTASAPIADDLDDHIPF